MSSASRSVSPCTGIDRDLVDLLGRLRGDFLDVHAAFAGGHQHHALRAAVDDHADVELLADVRAFLDQQPPHLLAFGAGLVRLQLHAEDRGSRAAHFVERVRELHAAALAAAAGVDLRLDDPDLAAELLRGFDRLVDAEAGMPRGVVTPNLRRISFAWYSWIFIGRPVRSISASAAAAQVG